MFLERVVSDRLLSSGVRGQVVSGRFHMYAYALYQDSSPIADARQARTLSHGFDIGRRIRSFPPLPTRLVLPLVTQDGTNQQRRTVTVFANQCFRRLDPQSLSSVIGLLEVRNGGVGGLDSASFEDD